MHDHDTPGDHGNERERRSSLRESPAPDDLEERLVEAVRLLLAWGREARERAERASEGDQ
jgi:hypothetical protein